MVSKNYLMEEGTLSKKDILSKNFIKNLKKKVPYQKSKKKRCLIKKPNQEHKKILYQKKNTLSKTLSRI